MQMNMKNLWVHKFVYNITGCPVTSSDFWSSPKLSFSEKKKRMMRQHFILLVALIALSIILGIIGFFISMTLDVTDQLWVR